MSQLLEWTVPLDHPAFEGHFIGMPILPGVVLLDKAIQLIAATYKVDMTSYKINTVKFLSPAKPGDVLQFEHSMSSKGMLNFTIATAPEKRKIATGGIVLNENI